MRGNLLVGLDGLAAEETIRIQEDLPANPEAGQAGGQVLRSSGLHRRIEYVKVRL